MAGTPASLADLVGDVDEFFAAAWAQRPVIFRSMCDFAGLITEQEIWDELDCGLLSRPYFTVFNEGVRAAIADITETRDVVGHQLGGFADAEQIRGDFAQGGTFKLNQAEHWHPQIRQLVATLRPHFSGELEAFVFLSPPDRTAMQAHTDGAHVLVMQVAGVKDWTIGRLTDQSRSDSTLHDGAIDLGDRIEATLHPGDVLYMPHGCPHFATARTGNSIHVAITIEEPNAVDLANVYLARFLGSPKFDALERSFHVMSTEELIERLRSDLADFLDAQDHEQALQAAVRLRRG